MTVDTVKKVNKPVVAEVQVINNYVSDAVKAMDMQTNVLQGRQHVTDVIRRDTLVLNAFPNKPQLLQVSYYK